MSKKKKLPEKLKEYRYENKVSQEKLASFLKVTKLTVLNWEAGTHKPSNFNRPDLIKIIGEWEE